MSQIISWTEIRTSTALAANRCCTFHVYRRFSKFLLYDCMIARKNQYGVSCFCYRLTSCSDVSHHRTAHKIHRIFCRCLSRHCYHFRKRRSQRNSYSYRMLYFRYNGNQLVRNRMIHLNCTINVIYCLYIEYRNAFFDGKTTRSYNTSGCLINQYDFITHRINFIQKSQTHARELSQMLIQSIHRIFIGLFHTNNGFLCTNSLSNHMECFHDLICMLFQ